MPKDSFDPMQTWRKQEKAREQRRKKALRDARLASQVEQSARRGGATTTGGASRPPEQQRSGAAGSKKLAFKVESSSRQRPNATRAGGDDAFWARDPTSLLEELRSLERLAAANDGLLPLAEQRIRKKHLSDQLARINKARRLAGLAQLELEAPRLAEEMPIAPAEDDGSREGQDTGQAGHDEKDRLLDDFYAEISHLL